MTARCTLPPAASSARRWSPAARRGILSLALAAASTLLGGAPAEPKPVIWTLHDASQIGGYSTELTGRPAARGGGLVFDGARDGVFVPAIPLVGAKQFTIEVLFSPAEGGGAAQRFVHVEDNAGRRALIELRLDSQGEWWLDTFMSAGGATRGLVLIDPARRHPVNRWYWAALRYDGATLAHFVDGVKECEGTGVFAPFEQGRVSLGVRQNKVSWFKGAIREVRFSLIALAPEKLQRAKP
jgi:hypothetical protein